MKTPPANLSSRLLARPIRSRAFTLAEIMTTLAIFSLVVIAMVSLQVFGFKMNALSAGKLKSTAYSLKALDQIRNQVRSANSVSVGSGDSTSFTATGTSGNALQIYSTTNVNFVRVYLNTNGTLCELNSTNNRQLTIASDITNQMVFQRVDYLGNMLTNNQEHYAIQMTLQFSQLDYRVPVMFAITTPCKPR